MSSKGMSDKEMRAAVRARAKADDEATKPVKITITEVSRGYPLAKARSCEGA